MKIYKFYADWCKPCGELKTELEGIDIQIEDINIDDVSNLDLIKQHKINKIPLILFLDDEGKTIKRLNGGSKNKITREDVENAYNHSIRL